MNNNVVVAEKNVDFNPKPSWWPADDEVIINPRQSRSSKPEVIYHLSPLVDKTKKEDDHLETSIVTQQPTSAQRAAVRVSEPIELEIEQVPPPTPFQLTGDSDSEQEEEEVFVNDIEDMAEERAVGPTQFSGGVMEDGEEWFRHFLNYCNYKGYNPPKSLALLKVLLTGAAAVWLDSLPAATTDDFDALKAAFDERYKTPEIMKYKSAKLIFSQKQKDQQTVDDYIASMLKLAKTIDSDDKLTQYALLNGLKPNIAAYVTQQQPTSIEALIQAARMAELTMPSQTDRDSVLSDQLADMKEEIRKMSTKWETAMTASVSSDTNRSMRNRPRSPSPQRRVTFAEEARTPVVDRPRFQSQQFRGGPANRGWLRPRFAGPAVRNMGYRQPLSNRCFKCGREAHSNINFCPALNKCCNICNRRGHFSIVCRAASRSLQQRTGQF